jgi:hypothetical protein
VLADELPVEPELEGQGADLVLEKLAERFDELEGQAFRKAADVVVGLDRLGRARDGFR